MKKLLFLQIALFASAVGLPAQHSFTPIDVEDGGRLYRPNCSRHFQSLTIVAYPPSIAAATATSTSGGNPAAGKAIYDGKGGCASCHRIRGEGSRNGPDLSDIGYLRLAGELERSITDPDAEILPQNRTFRAVTREGATITGTLLNEDKYAVQVLDSTGRL